MFGYDVARTARIMPIANLLPEIIDLYSAGEIDDAQAFTTQSGMETFHPLAADADVPSEDVALAQGECALALGRIDGLLVGLSAGEERLFCARLLREVRREVRREVLRSALAKAGVADAELCFNA